MKKMTTLPIVLAAALCAAPLCAAPRPDAASEIVALERQAMDGWLAGNPEPFLAMCDPDITYFHVMTERRADGLAAVRAIVEPFRGRSLFDGYEMLAPTVLVGGETAVLSYVLVRRIGSVTSRWNATEVFQRKAQGWRLVHSHWSQTAPRGPGSQDSAR